MQVHITILSLIRLLVLLLVLAPALLPAQSIFQRKPLHLAPGDSATFMFTNNYFSFFYGEASRLASSKLQGFTVLTEKYVEDYVVFVDGAPLQRRTAEVHILRNRLVRIYPDSALIEEVVLADTANVLTVRFTLKHPRRLTFCPVLSGSRNAGDFVLETSQDGTTYYASRRPAEPNEANGSPLYISVFSEPTAQAQELGRAIRDSLAAQFSNPVFVPCQFSLLAEQQALFFIAIDAQKSDYVATKAREQNPNN